MQTSSTLRKVASFPFMIPPLQQVRFTGSSDSTDASSLMGSDGVTFHKDPTPQKTCNPSRRLSRTPLEALSSVSHPDWKTCWLMCSHHVKLENSSADEGPHQAGRVPRTTSFQAFGQLRSISFRHVSPDWKLDGVIHVCVQVKPMFCPRRTGGSYC